MKKAFTTGLYYGKKQPSKRRKSKNIMYGEQTAVERRELYMSAFKDAVTKQDLGAAICAFAEDVMKGNEYSLNDAKDAVIAAYSKATSYQISISLKSELETLPQTAKEAIQEYSIFHLKS